MLKIKINNVILLIITLVYFYFNGAVAMEVAITVDDIPANSTLPSSSSRLEVAKKMLSVFEKHKIAGVYGLINGSKLTTTPHGYEIMQAWIKRGQLLGNHAYGHLDLAKTNSAEFIADITENEPILKSLMQDKNYHYFRYPFLAEGNTQEKRDSVRQFLFANGYQIAPVTVDFFEYEWNEPYVRCLKKGDREAIKWLKKAYIKQAVNALIISHELSMMLFNRDIKNVLLIHLNSMTIDMLDELLTAYEKQSVKFISLPDALSDEVYQINPNILRDRAYTFLNQVRLSRGLANPEIVSQLYASFPEDYLTNLCR